MMAKPIEHKQGNSKNTNAKKKKKSQNHNTQGPSHLNPIEVLDHGLKQTIHD